MWKTPHGPVVTVADGPVHEHIEKPARAVGVDGEEFAGDHRSLLADEDKTYLICDRD